MFQIKFDWYIFLLIASTLKKDVIICINFIFFKRNNSWSSDNAKRTDVKNFRCPYQIFFFRFKMRSWFCKRKNHRASYLTHLCFLDALSFSLQKLKGEWRLWQYTLYTKVSTSLKIYRKFVVVGLWLNRSSVRNYVIILNLN